MSVGAARIAGLYHSTSRASSPGKCTSLTCHSCLLQAAAERLKAQDGKAEANAGAAPRSAAGKSGRRSEDSKPSRLTSKIASMLPSPKVSVLSRIDSFLSRL